MNRGLQHLTKRILDIVHASNDSHPILNASILHKQLNDVYERRIYDILTVWRHIGVIEKIKGKRCYRWQGIQSVNYTLAQWLNAKAMPQRFRKSGIIAIRLCLFLMTQSDTRITVKELSEKLVRETQLKSEKVHYYCHRRLYDILHVLQATGIITIQNQHRKRYGKCQIKWMKDRHEPKQEIYEWSSLPPLFPDIQHINQCQLMTFV